jgi:hypothetical protein
MYVPKGILIERQRQTRTHF